MARVVAFANVTLDGVMQAPGRPDEDRRGDFPNGGWAGPPTTPWPKWEEASPAARRCLGAEPARTSIIATYHPAPRGA